MAVALNDMKPLSIIIIRSNQINTAPYNDTIFYVDLHVMYQRGVFTMYCSLYKNTSEITIMPRKCPHMAITVDRNDKQQD